MTTDRLRSALATIRWGPLDLAGAIAVNERTVRRWIAGQNPAPEPILAWLETLAAFHAAHPAPGKS